MKVTDDFWGQRLQANREVTIPLVFSKCESEGRYENFVKAANPGTEHIFKGFGFDDTDVYKVIEGASYSIQTCPDRKLEAYMDSVIALIAAAQEPDGYLFTPRTMNPAHEHRYNGKNRWDKVESASHEFYNLGHLLEAAVAHYQATGKRTLLDIGIKYADCIYNEIGEGEGKIIRVPGHQIAEMGLAKLYTVTGEKKYLELAKFFLDKRGYTSRKDAYSQAHKPVLQQDEAVGHAVRAGYMYSGMADVAALTGDTGYIHAIDKIWENVISKKIYITGGIGARHSGEAFGDNYELPNESAYNETCAAIANVYWNYRLFLLHGESKYFDVLERTLYNGLISGVSLDGGKFFYPNPLACKGNYERQAWFGCACCPSNISRFIPSLPQYIYAVRDNQLFVNLFIGNTATVTVGNKKVEISQKTDYPWNGDVRLAINPKGKQNIALKIRIPGWVKGKVLPGNLYEYADNKKTDYSVKVNGTLVENNLKDGYLVIDRIWKKGDVVDIHFDMEVRTVKANSKVKSNVGKLSVERGPIVYCAEWKDNGFNLFNAVLLDDTQFSTENLPNKLGGIVEITTDVQVVEKKDGKTGLVNAKLTLIPYYSWANRGQGAMNVWQINNLPEILEQ